TASVTIADLRLTGAAGDAIQQLDPGSTLTLHRVVIDENAGYGISANRGTLTMDGCVVSGNNAGGVSAQDVTFSITSSIFVVNGDTSSSTVGGLRLAPVGASRFEFNTVADNASTLGNEGTRSLNCTAALTVRNSIFRTNWPNTTGVGGACTAQFSLFDMTAPATGDNKTGDPMFDNVNPLAPTHPAYYRIKAGSPAVDSADPSAPPTSDIDGDPRPMNGRSDIGADELL
ncbi:MAG: right-handed parallel beta-helix repeat-containing protein, partial [Kofleriaceae bacterium]|nr:right-handed parallel beta-helix repeat-containing protein [Kofleriaceae bacterium]